MHVVNAYYRNINRATATVRLRECSADLLQSATVRGRISDAWGIIQAIFNKEGDALGFGNCRGIKLICHTMKVYESLVDMWVREAVKILEDQFDFLPERSTITLFSLCVR
ncbi:hypothetical protein Y032_1028g3433 [Ancylostoma ceylanicum]|uniref:Reverse transcriptase domain-containing protein n=1 Tax=Ancylostoma ceylanicum TaxID=53326 RepID=A0A016W7L0_9BILA|nr:hypothetical protein Y032_1028g3433 [Ancylostoma ceylanicum]